MSEIQKNVTLGSVLVDAAKSGVQLRVYGANMTILAEGIVAFVGNGVVALKHRKKEEPDEFVVTACIVKIQFLGDYRHY